MTKTYLLPEKVLAAILAYLQTKPYNEVVHGISALASLREATEVSKAEEEAAND